MSRTRGTQDDRAGTSIDRRALLTAAVLAGVAGATSVDATITARRPTGTARPKIEGGHVVTRSGHRLFFRDWGNGPPVLLIIGWAMTSDVWSDVMLRLNAAGLRTIAFDRRGHGRSSDPGFVDIDSLADDLNDVIEALALDGLTIVPHSIGTTEVVRYLSRHGSARVKKLIMVAPQGPCLLPRPDNPNAFPRERVEKLCRRLAEDLPAWVEENAAVFAPGAPPRAIDWLISMILGCSRRIAVDMFRANAEADMRPEYAGINRPVTVIHGDSDGSAPIAITGRRIAAIVPGAELVIYEKGTSGLMVTHPARLAEDIRSRVPIPH